MLVGAGRIELEHRKLGVMGVEQLPVPEDLADLENRTRAFREQPLHRILGTGMEIERTRRPRVHFWNEMNFKCIDVWFHSGSRHQRRCLDFLVSECTQSRSK